MLILNAITSHLQAALFSGFAVAAPGAEIPEPEGDAIGTEDTSERARRYCSASSDGSPTGRQWAQVRNSPREPYICLREKLGGVADRGVPDCWKMARDIGCDQVVDID